VSCKLGASGVVFPHILLRSRSSARCASRPAAARRPCITHSRSSAKRGLAY
jgi:hypothetical protein